MIFRRMKSMREIRQAEKQFEEDMQQVELEKNDRLAMIMAAFVIFVPAALIVIAILVLVPLLFFRIL